MAMNDLNPIVPEPEYTHSERLSPAPARRGSLRDALVPAFYHARLIRACLLFGVVLGMIGAVLSKPSFDANALVLVLIGPNSMSAQDAAGMSPTVVSIDGLKVVQSEVQIIQNDQVLRMAVQRVGPGVIYPGLARRRLFGLLPPRSPTAQLGEAVQKLRGALRVDAEPGSNVVKISFADPNRRVAIRVVQAVLDAYLAQRRASYTGTNARFLTQEIERYRHLLGSLDAQIQAVRTKYAVLDLAQDIVLADDRLDGIVQRRNQVRERQVAVATEIQAVKANLAKQPEMVLDFTETSNNTGNDEARNTLVRLEQQLTYLRSQFNPSWPAIAEVEKKIATARNDMGPKAGNLYHTERKIRNPALDLLENHLASLEVEHQALGQQLDELAVQYDQADQRIKSLRQAEGQLHGLQLTREVTEGIYRQLAQKQPAALLQERLSGDPNASLRVVQPAAAPVIGRSLALSYIIGGALLGLLLGAAATAIATMLRQVYIAPAEAERELALPALATFDAALAKDDLEHSTALVQLAAILQEATVDGRPLSSLQIFGLSAGDDRVALIRALAMELARGYERTTLIIDLEGDGAPYTALLGRGDAAAPSSLPLPVAATHLPRLWVSTGRTAQTVLNDWHSSIACTRAVLDELRQQFGLLLIVAPAEVSGHAVHRLATMVDASMPILRAEHTRGPVALRLRDAIHSAGGNMLGFVFVGRKYYVPAWLFRWI